MTKKILCPSVCSVGSFFFLFHKSFNITKINYIGKVKKNQADLTSLLLTFLIFTDTIKFNIKKDTPRRK